MKIEFSKEYIYDNRGCYSKEQVDNLPFINNDKITIKMLFDNLPFKDFDYWLLQNCKMTERDKEEYVYHYASFALPIFEERHPDNKKPREALEAKRAWIDNPTDENRRRIYATTDAAMDTYNSTWDDVWKIINAEKQEELKAHVWEFVEKIIEKQKS